MSTDSKKPLEVLRSAVLGIVGLLMVTTPLALWVAWSLVGFVLALGIGVAAGVLFCVLYSDSKVTNEEQYSKGSESTIKHLDDEFLSELSEMGPFIYHNRLSGDATFRRKMAYLKKKLGYV